MGGGGRGGVMGGMDGGGGDGGYGSGGMDGGMGGMGMGGMGMGGMGMGGGMGGMTSAKPAWEMPVEVYGVIYLYNPVSIKRLGLDKVTENTEVADKVETPAVTEPVPVAAPAAASSAVPANPNPNVPAPASGAPASGAPAGAPAGIATPNPAEASGTQAPANPQ